MADAKGVPTWLHIGDLHMVEAGEQNCCDLERIIGPMRDLPPGSFDAAVLPGDNGNSGCCVTPLPPCPCRFTNGATDEDQVEPAAPGWTPPSRIGDGGDRDRSGAWPKKFIFDTQRGPNLNGRQW